MYMASESLSRWAFSSLVSEWLGTVMDWEAPFNDDATRYRCSRRNVEPGLAAEMLVTFCVRRHRSHEGMYDLFVRSALLGRSREGVVSTLRATPISFSNAKRLTRSWLASFGWSR